MHKCFSGGGVQPLIAEATSYSEETQYGDYLYYEMVDVDEDGTYDYVEISGCDTSATEVEIPSEIEGLPVTSIGNKAFYYCNSLTSITIPDSVTSIRIAAFRSCTSLANITIPDSVTSIASSAFSECTSLESITIKNPECEILDDENTISDTATIYGYENSTAQAYAENYGHEFESLGEAPAQPVVGDLKYKLIDEDEDGTYDCVEISDCDTSATEVEIPSTIEGLSVTSIGDNAFEACESLTNITIPDSVTSIGNYAFYLCSSFTNITIPESVTSIGSSAFYGCKSLTSITIGDGVTSIGDDVFSNCTSLTSITIGDGVTSIGDDVFSNCTSLTSITIGDSVASIEDYAFRFCDSLTDINVSENNAYYSSIDGVLFNKEQTELLVYPRNKTDELYVIPDSVTSIVGIGNGAFSWCGSLTSIIIPDSVTSIGNDAFYYCTSLESIIIPDSVTSIGNEAFYYCTSLESIIIPESVTSIGEAAFMDCTSLKSIIIPDSVTSIERAAFYGCDSLESITIPNSVTSIGDIAFCGCTVLESITIENPECEIFDNENTINDTVTIYGYDNSTTQNYAKYGYVFVQTYANKYGCAFESLGEAPAQTTPTVTTTATTTTKTTTTTAAKTTADETTAATTTTSFTRNYVGSCELRADVNVRAGVGETIQVPIYLNTYGKTIEGIGAKVIYDETALKLTSFIDPYDARYDKAGLDNAVNEFVEETNIIFITLSNGVPMVNDPEYPIVIAEFEVLDEADGVYEINFGNNLFTWKDVEVVYSTDDEIEYLKAITVPGNVVVGDYDMPVVTTAATTTNTTTTTKTTTTTAAKTTADETTNIPSATTNSEADTTGNTAATTVSTTVTTASTTTATGTTRPIGDANNDGKVTVADAAFIARTLAKRETIDVKDNPYADYSGDGKVTVADAAAIARYLAKAKK